MEILFCHWCRCIGFIKSSLKWVLNAKINCLPELKTAAFGRQRSDHHLIIWKVQIQEALYWLYSSIWFDSVSFYVIFERTQRAQSWERPCVCVCGMDPLGPLWLPCKWATLLRNCSLSKREERWGQQRRGWKFWFCWWSIVLQRKGGLWFTVITGIRSLKSFSLSLSGSVLLSVAPFQRK